MVVGEVHKCRADRSHFVSYHISMQNWGECINYYSSSKEKNTVGSFSSPSLTYIGYRPHNWANDKDLPFKIIFVQ